MARNELRAEVTGKVWKIVVPAGGTVNADDAIVIIESMKMEIPVASEKPGAVIEIRVKEGESISEGQVVAVVET